MRLRLIVNPAAGSREPILAILNDVYGPSGVDWSVRLTHADHDPVDLARQAVDEGFDAIGVYGGDGTVSAVASGLVGADVPLVILPGGTGNALSQDLGLPQDLAGAAALALRARELATPVDMLDLGDRTSLLRVGLGADARTILRADREAKNRLGWFAYLQEALAQLDDAPQALYRLEVDGYPVERRAATCVLLNSGRLGRGGISLSKQTSPMDGLLDLFLVRDNGLGSIAAVGASVLGMTEPAELQDADPEAALLHVQAEHVVVTTEPPQPVHVDGDAWDPDSVGEGRIEARVRPGALLVCIE